MGMNSSRNKDTVVPAYPSESVRYQMIRIAKRMTDEQMDEALDLWRIHRYSGAVRFNRDGSVSRVESLDPGPWHVYGLCEDGGVLNDGHCDYWVPWPDLHECLSLRIDRYEGQDAAH